MDTHLTNISVFAEIMGVDAKTLHNWYKNNLSGFEPDGAGHIHEHDIKVETAHGQTNIEVPILQPENIGANMGIDEKMIGEQYYTILSNRETGKIAFCAGTTKSDYLKQAVEPLLDRLSQVKRITRDMAGCYARLSEEVMPNAIQIADKFHVINNLLDAMQAVRIRFRQKLLEQRRKTHQEFKESEKQRLIDCEKNHLQFTPKKFIYKEDRLANGETPNELLLRSHFLLYKFPTQWKPWQMKRAELLFKVFPEIKTAFYLTCSFRTWYSNENIGQNQLQTLKNLYQWYEDVDDADIDELSNFKSLVESNENEIVEYFTNGETNAKAENLNGQIKKFLASNKGIRNTDFFFFRLSKYFA